MRKLILFALAVCVLLSMAAMASDKGKEVTVTGWVTDPMCGVKHAKAGGESCVKSCAKDGKLAFVSDGESKVWAVENSETLKGHEGHHIKLTGHPNAEKGTIHVMTVAMLGGEKAQSDKAHDDAHKHGDAKKDKMKDETKTDKKK